MRPAFAVLAAFALAPFAAAPGIAQEGGQEPPPAVVVVAQVSAASMAETVTVPGSIVSRNDSRIAAEVSGRVDWVAEIGAQVEAGGAIARVDGALLELQAKSAEADVKRLQARVDFLAAEVQRLEALAGKGSATRQKLDQARSERDMARQELATAEVALARARYDLDRAEVKSPFPGRVAARLIEPGEFIARGAAVARVVDISALEVTAQIPVASVAAIKEGDRLTVEGPSGAVEALVRALVPVGDQVSRSAELRATLGDTAWLVGTAVKVAIPNGPATERLAVPRDALLLRPEGRAVFRVGEGDVAELVPVEPGLTAGDLVSVTGDLKAGDRVVIRGGETLQPGQKVQIQSGIGMDRDAVQAPG